MSDRDGVGDGVGRSGTAESSSRRRFLASGGTVAAGAFAGCSSLLGTPGSEQEVTIGDFRGSGPMVEQRPEPGGERIADLPDLSGDLNVYLGGGESGLYRNLVRLFEEIYPDFSAPVKFDSTRNLVNAITQEEEAGSSPADVFIAVDAGSLGAVAEAGATASLPSAALDPVRDEFRDSDGRWVGVAGRARAIPYNTDEYSADDVPDEVAELPDLDRFAGSMGWAPSYPAFQSFVTAMRLSRDDQATKQWLRGMLDQGVSTHDNEFDVSNRVADGELGAGFANHYYSLRVKSNRSDAPLDLAFTSNDAGALVNVSGAQVIGSSEKQELAGNFVRHLLSAEAQEFFATRTFAYPMISGVTPVGDLPTIDDLEPPDIDLTRLSDVSGTLDLMREVNVL